MKKLCTNEGDYIIVASRICGTIGKEQLFGYLTEYQGIKGMGYFNHQDVLVSFRPWDEFDKKRSEGTYRVVNYSIELDKAA